MFERIGTIWRRLTKGEKPTADPSADTHEDRRAFNRYPAQVETTVHLANSSDPTPYPARVRNISQGGISVLVGKEFAPGQLLSVELPTLDKQVTFTVLVCVVHSVPHGKNEWALGGTFARELSEEDLLAVGARKQRAAESDKRSWERFPCNLKASYSIVTADEDETYSARVLDISASGLGLAVDRAIEAGVLLSVDLMNATGKVIRTILACVVHASCWQDGRRAIGCNFIRQLTEEDLKSLI
jgi:c-di-GMP-binding flagellar brake protein YcgR